MSSARRLLALVAIAVCAAALAAQARADGDPASDFLVSQDAFVPFDAKIPQDRAAQITRLVADANAKGFRIKLALIGTPYDLGSVTALWRQPQRYADFLGQELYYTYHGPLLIAMPNGYGIYDHGRPVRAQRTLLGRLPKPGAANLAPAAATAVQRLARAKGVELSLQTAGKKSNATRDRLIILGAVLAAALVATLALGARRFRRRAAE
jgi:hypothetical protein